MPQRLPPWGAIEAFVAAAAADSFRQAADRLAISAPALSRRIQALERHVDARLFDRSGSRIALTPAGARYLALLQPGIAAVQAATSDMAPGASGRPLRLRVSNSLASAWLGPRLGAFCDAHPQVKVELQSGGRPRDLADDKADIGIYHGNGAWPGLTVARLFGATASVVAAPHLADGRVPPQTLEEVAGYRLLGLSDPGDVWATWSRRLLPGAPPLVPAVTFDAAGPMYEAAAHGLGLALGVRPLVSPYLCAGRLLEVAGTTLRWPGAYHMAALPRTLRTAPAWALWTWLQRAAAVLDTG